MISFYNSDVTYLLRDKRKIADWITRVVKKEKLSINSLSIILSSDEFLYQLNVQHLQHDTYTDIITFDYSVTKGKIEGELYISIERVKENAGKLGISILNELHRVIIHGVLHLCGYKDKSKAHKTAMTRAEDRSLAIRNFA